MSGHASSHRLPDTWSSSAGGSLRKHVTVKCVMRSEFGQGLGCCAQVGEMERLPPTWDLILLPFFTPPCFDTSYIKGFLANSISSSFVAFLLLWPPQQHCLKGRAELWDVSWVGGVEQQQHGAGSIWEQLPSRASTFCRDLGLVPSWDRERPEHR